MPVATIGTAYRFFPSTFGKLKRVRVHFGLSPNCMDHVTIALVVEIPESDYSIHEVLSLH